MLLLLPTLPSASAQGSVAGVVAFAVPPVTVQPPGMARIGKVPNAAEVIPPAGSLETKAIFAVPSSRKVNPVGRLSRN